MSLFKRVLASTQARFVQPWQQKHFESTKYGKRIKQYKNIYAGRRCFFIGNGPSLKAEDLTTLYEHEEITFAFNRIYNIFDNTLWRPTFYISQDEKMLQGCADIVDQLELPVKFIPIQLFWYHNINIHDALYFNMNWQQAEDPRAFLFSDDAAQELDCASTGMYTAAQIAAYMGFTEIYFIGVDHHFRVSQNLKGEIVVDDTVKDYFSDQYNEDKANLYIPNTEKSTLTYIAMKKQCEKRNVKVFNATRGGMLEVFPRVEFDMLFN
jgi:hypothetical protein